jgi:sarcosine oxidase subunit alpha
MSPTLRRSFAMALVVDGRAKIGQTVYATGMESARPMKIVEPVFYDKEGQRLDA